MPRRRSDRRSRSEWLLAEKGEHRNYSTRGELARTLGVRVDLLKVWEKKGVIPPPDAITEHGWKLWAPETVGRIIRWRTNRGSR